MLKRVLRNLFFQTLFVLILGASAIAKVERPITLSFNPEEGTYERYMTVITLGGYIIEPEKELAIGIPTYLAIGIPGVYRLRAVYRDSVESVLSGMNRHLLTFYDFDILQILAERRREQGRGGGWGGPGGGGPGGGGGGPSSASPPQDSRWEGPLGGLPLPGSEGAPLQAGPPGGGGGGGGGAPSGPPAGASKTFSIDDILVTSLEYVESKNGDILDIQSEALKLLREYSRHATYVEEDEPGEIKLDIGHLFEWTHLLRLPDYPVWREDMWFATVPVSVPGLREPIPMKMIYRLIGFTRVGPRQIAIIDVDGVEEFHQYWEEDLLDKTVKYEAAGSFTLAARYFFDYEKGTVFGIERPPIVDYTTLSFFPGSWNFRFMELKYPGLTANLEMKYYTEEKKKKKTKFEEEPQAKLTRRYVAITFIMQTEAE